MKTFEERLNRLEVLSRQLKEGNIPLEQAVTLFEEGMRLARGLEKELARIERRVEIMVNEPEKKGASEEPILELFPELNGENGQA